MSKSMGNVYYPSDLLAKGFSGGQLRFFLIYGPYRKKLNFTFEKLAVTTRKLDSFKKMIAELQEAKPSSLSEKEEKLTGKILSDFETFMNNDLDVKSAFDSLYKTIGSLYGMRWSLGAQDIKNAVTCLRRVDSVLQCIF
jgi:cysteinyl-tRNA synthetase